MRRTNVTKVHSVKAKMQVVELTKAGSSMNLEVFANKLKIGEIIIGRGSFEWISKGKTSGKRYSWSRFAELMNYLRETPPRIKKKDNI